MLTFMRKHAKFFYVFFFLIIISFVFFYVGPVDQNGPSALIEVKKERVSIEEFWRAYDNMRSFYRDIYKDKFTAEMEKQLNLKDRILSELVSAKVLFVAAREMGLSVSDKELMDSIVNDPTFQRDGKFRQDIYLNALKLSRMTPGYYEEKKREELLVRKMRTIVESSVIVPDEEIPQIQGNDALQKTLRESIINSKKAQAVQAYVEAMKMKYGVAVRAELIS
ncbi:MAG: SurA N-terminal domain-containing protein [bacterium]